MLSAESTKLMPPSPFLAHDRPLCWHELHGARLPCRGARCWSSPSSRAAARSRMKQAVLRLWSACLQRSGCALLVFTILSSCCSLQNETGGAAPVVSLSTTLWLRVSCAFKLSFLTWSSSSDV